MFCSKCSALFHSSEVWKYNRNEAECDLGFSEIPTALNKAFDQVTLSQLAPVSLGMPFGMFLPNMEVLTSGLAPVCVAGAGGGGHKRFMHFPCDTSGTPTEWLLCTFG